MRRFAWIIAAVFLAAPAAPAAAMPGFEAGVRGTYWFPDLSAKIQTFDPPPAGTKFDVKDDLGVGDENLPSGEAFLRVGRFHLRAGFTPVSFDGSKALAREIVFSGQTFTVSDTVISSLDMKMLDGEIQVDILRPDLVAASFYLGLVGKVKYVDGEVELRGSAVTERKDFKAPIPMVGLAAGAGLLKDMVRIDARAAGMAYSGNHLYEGEVYLSFAPFPFVRIQGGYRWIDLQVDKDDVVAELTLKGPYAGAQISF
ncbi:MAG: hypothetical protein A2X88_04250 [Deltaproteobacteria bacterium GWC2_65_14]|nr:MAG: hypothetical protein A2X88_04250 [Deltaproteobacteria bacterium GWC2_65_14]